MGHPQIETPRLDQFARESMTFKRGYVPTSLCRPSLATIITGLYPHQHRITGNDPLVSAELAKKKNSAEYLAARDAIIQNYDRVDSLPKILKARGYRSFQSGKWWEGSFTRGGFDQGMTHGDSSKGGRHGDEGLKIGRSGMEPIFEFVRQDSSKPFFVWYAPFLPHTPHTAPVELLAKYEAKGVGKELAKYYAMCEWFDRSCGELFDFLEKEGHAENTIVVYVSDNGWIQKHPGLPLPEKWSMEFAPRSKQSPYEGGIRTPIMVRWPAKLRPRMDDETLVSSIDLVPTILDALDIEQPSQLHGLSLLEDPEKLRERKELYGEIFAHDIADPSKPEKGLLYRWAIRGNLKLIEAYDGIQGNYAGAHLGRTTSPQVYDLNSDPHETKNLLTETSVEAIDAIRKSLKEVWDPMMEALK